MPRQYSVLFPVLCSMTLASAACGRQAVKSFDSSASSLNSSASYTASIQQLAQNAQKVLEQGLTEFNSDTLPHEAKDLRKQIVRLRDILDIYSHNFAEELSLWDDVRDGLDDGYTVVGNFKDLFDSQIEPNQIGITPRYKDEKKLEERRNLVLKWKRDYFQNGGWGEKVRVLFLRIQPLSPSAILSSAKFSKFFWGGVGVLPSSTNTPAQNARLLVDAQSQRVFDEHGTFLELKNLRKEKNEIVFHDHRKRIRTLSKICVVANSLEEETCDSQALKLVDTLVSQLGEIEDLIVAARLKEQDGKDKKADEYYERAEEMFDDLRNEGQGHDLLRPLSQL